MLIDYYQTTDEIYHDIRKIVFTKNPPHYKKIYAYRVVQKLDSEENQQKLPKGINLRAEDYELTELMRLIKNNPDFNIRYNWTYPKALIEERLEKEEWQNNLRLLIKG